MKTKILILLCITVSIRANAQLAVIAANTDKQLFKIGGQLTKTNSLLRQQNNLLKKLVDVMKASRLEMERIRTVQEDLINSKRISPDYVINSNEVEGLEGLRKKVVQVFKQIRININGLENISSKERTEFLSFYGAKMNKVMQLLSDSNDVVNTNSIIDPEQRIKLVKNNRIFIKKILDEIIQSSSTMEQVSKGRLATKSIKSF